MESLLPSDPCSCFDWQYESCSLQMVHPPALNIHNTIHTDSITTVKPASYPLPWNDELYEINSKTNASLPNPTYPAPPKGIHTKIHYNKNYMYTHQYKSCKKGYSLCNWNFRVPAPFSFLAPQVYSPKSESRTPQNTKMLVILLDAPGMFLTKTLKNRYFNKVNCHESGKIFQEICKNYCKNKPLFSHMIHIYINMHNHAYKHGHAHIQEQQQQMQSTTQVNLFCFRTDKLNAVWVSVGVPRFCPDSIFRTAWCMTCTTAVEIWFFFFSSQLHRSDLGESQRIKYGHSFMKLSRWTQQTPIQIMQNTHITCAGPRQKKILSGLHDWLHHSSSTCLSWLDTSTLQPTTDVQHQSTSLHFPQRKVRKTCSRATCSVNSNQFCSVHTPGQTYCESNPRPEPRLVQVMSPSLGVG